MSISMGFGPSEADFVVLLAAAAAVPPVDSEMSISVDFAGNFSDLLASSAFSAIREVLVGGWEASGALETVLGSFSSVMVVVRGFVVCGVHLFSLSRSLPPHVRPFVLICVVPRFKI